MTDDTSENEEGKKVTKRTTEAARVFFCWTYFGDDVEENRPCIPDELCVYRIQGKETCPETGRKHLQCFAHLRKRMRWSTLHKRYPGLRNLEVCKGTPYQNFLYCSKEGDFIEVGTRPTEIKSRKADENKCFSDALNADTLEEGISIIKQEAPRDWCIHSANITYALQQNKKKKFVHKYNEFKIDVLPTDKAILIYGPSGIGKTAYALSHFENPLLVTHMDKLRELTSDHDGIVFDDMSFKHYPPEAIIALLDMEYDRDIHTRYRCSVIPEGMPRIFTHNTENPFYEETIHEDQKEAIGRRLRKVHLEQKLY